MAEWLRRGLQILARRFDSGSGLQSIVDFDPKLLIFSESAAAMAATADWGRDNLPLRARGALEVACYAGGADTGVQRMRFRSAAAYLPDIGIALQKAERSAVDYPTPHLPSPLPA